MPFIGALIGAGVQVGTSIFGAIQANKAKKAQIKLAEQQMDKANKLRETAEANKVDYKTPQELEDNIANAKLDLASGDNVVQAAAEQAGQTVANIGKAAERTATSGSQALAAVTSANVEAGKEVGAAEESAEARRAAKKRALTAANVGIAGSRDREFDINVAQPYFQAISDARQLEDAAILNRQGAINTGAQNAANLTRAVGKAGTLLASVDDSAFRNPFKRTVQGQMTRQ